MTGNGTKLEILKKADKKNLLDATKIKKANHRNIQDTESTEKADFRNIREKSVKTYACVVSGK